MKNHTITIEFEADKSSLEGLVRTSLKLNLFSTVVSTMRTHQEGISELSISVVSDMGDAKDPDKKE